MTDFADFNLFSSSSSLFLRSDITFSAFASLLFPFIMFSSKIVMLEFKCTFSSLSLFNFVISLKAF